ncbi:hypothetical protein ABTX62_32920 [Streptomyces sp. NPDC096046]
MPRTTRAAAAARTRQAEVRVGGSGPGLAAPVDHGDAYRQALVDG